MNEPDMPFYKYGWTTIGPIWNILICVPARGLALMCLKVDSICPSNGAQLQATHVYTVRKEPNASDNAHYIKCKSILMMKAKHKNMRLVYDEKSEVVWLGRWSDLSRIFFI